MREDQTASIQRGWTSGISVVNHTDVIGGSEGRHNLFDSHLDQIVLNQNWSAANTRLFIVLKEWAADRRGVDSVPVDDALKPIVGDVDIEESGPGEATIALRIALVSRRQSNAAHPTVEGVSIDGHILRHLEFHKALRTAARTRLA